LFRFETYSIIKMKEPARKYIFLVLCFEIAIIGMQVYTIDQDTWWWCDLTAHAPIMNTSNTSTHTVEISIKMRTSLDDTCWYVKQIEESPTVNDTLVPRPITKCVIDLYGSLKLAKIQAIDKARTEGKHFLSFTRSKEL